MSTDAIVLLKQDHKEIRGLFRQFRSAKTASSRKAAVRKIIKGVRTLSYLENECVLPRLRELVPDLADDLLRSAEENHVADVLCAELAELTPADERFTAKATVLVETVSRHFANEEGDRFRRVRDGVGRTELREIGAEMITMRKKAPRAPKSTPPPRTDVSPTAPPADDDQGDGKQDVVDLLLRQHSQIRDLFLEVEEATGKARAEAFSRLVRLLAVHETAEEQVVHPMTRLRVHGGDDIVGDRLAEEHAAKETLAELERMGPDAPDFPHVLDQLRADVLDHAGKEEAYEFRYLRREVSAVELRAMAAAVMAAEAIAPTHPHPGVESATANTLAGPVLSLFDRTKDLVRAAISTSS